MKQLAILTAAAALCAPLAHAQNDADASRPWMNASLSPRQRAELLVRAMTLDEKISQIHMVDQRAHPREVAPIPRLGIPIFKVTNGPAGAGPGDKNPTQPATAMPSALALAASWDPSLAAKFGETVGQEVADRGESLLEGPGVNITRVALNGRNFEYFGEDPYLNGRIGVAEIRGIQRQGVIAQVKHFDANSQEFDRKNVNELIGERTLREIYLPAFEAAVKEGGVASVMAAYPAVNGQFCCENVFLLDQVLRKDWGFQGFVQSDYTATNSAVRSARAGLSLSMRPDHYSAEMKRAIESGQVSEARLDELVIERFTQMFRLGILDHPHTPRPIPAKRDGAISREISEQCAVLLKNGGVLPLAPASLRTVAVVGPYAGRAMTGGGGSSQVNPLYTVSPVDGLRARLGPGVNVVFDDGSDPDAAAAAARKADLVIVMVGNKDSEGRDRKSLSLPLGQDALIDAVSAANPRTVVVLKTGGPVLMPWLNHVAAVLEAWYPGEEDGNVVAALLCGDVNPSGKLPMTFPRTESQTPVNSQEQYPGFFKGPPPHTPRTGVNTIVDTVVYSEGLSVGYRWYDAHNETPLFPFGYGQSYTTFAITNLSLAWVTANGWQEPGTPSVRLAASMDITNTGRTAGADVVQIYVADPDGIGEPPRQLRGFQKVFLEPGATRHVTIALDPRSFSIWDTQRHGWVKAVGPYTVYAGDSSRDLPLHASLLISQ